jgi:hypothetical protein
MSAPEKDQKGPKGAQKAPGTPQNRVRMTQTGA